MQESDKSQHDRTVQAALDEHEPNLQEILQIANQTPFASADERDMSLVSSGFSHGWTVGMEAGETSGIHKSAAFDLIRKSITVLDGFLVDDAPLATVEALRNEAGEYLNRANSAMFSAFYRSMAVTYGFSAAAVLRKSAPLSDEDAFDLGVCVFAADRGAFYGFVVFSEDQSVPCRCPYHCKVALAEKAITQEQAEKAMVARFSTKRAALPEFGRWFHNTIKEHLAKEMGPTQVVADLNMVGAAQVAHDMLTKFGLGGGK